MSYDVVVSIPVGKRLHESILIVFDVWTRSDGVTRRLFVVTFGLSVCLEMICDRDTSFNYHYVTYFIRKFCEEFTPLSVNIEPGIP